jgi:hypothetical protein
MENERPQLDYAPPTPWLRRRSSRWIAGLCFFLIALGFALRWENQIVNRVRANLAFAQCMKYSKAADHVAYGETPGVQTITKAEPWTMFYSRWSENYLMSDGTLFLHERHTPSAGSRRLVAVDIVGQFASAGLSVEARVFEPPMSLAPARMKSTSTILLDLGENPIPFQVFSGQPDPNDQSHFTIDVHVAGCVIVFDGWLKDDDRVVIEARTQSVTPPPPSSRGSSR